MEPAQVDVKPTIPAGDTPNKGPLAVLGIATLKQSRYEDVWPEDVHAAFMEAIALYPPMGKRRLKYYRVSTHENEHFSKANRAKSFGRCQLIQSYILEKTGKNRSRKQVSSHLQRLKKIHKDNPAMFPLFSECSQPPSERSSALPARAGITPQDTSANIPVSIRHLKSDPELSVDFQNTGTGALSSSIFPHAVESLNGGAGNTHLSTNFHDQPSFFTPLEFVAQQFPASNLHSSDCDYLSELQDSFLFKDAMNEGFRSVSAFNTSAFSISMRRFASKLPIQGRLVDLDPAVQFSRAVNSPGLQPTYQWISHDNSMDTVSCNSPFTSPQETFHMPFLPLQLNPSERRLGPGLASEWIWPKNVDTLPDPRDGSFDEIRLRYPAAVYQHNSACPGVRVNTPGCHSSPSEDEVSGLPRGISHSYATTSPMAMTESASNEGAINFPRQPSGSPENLASPLVISPTPTYPISYIHSDIQSEGRTPAPSLPP